MPACLIALENEKPIAFLVLRPSNHRGSCWFVNLPELLSEPTKSTRREITHSLLQTALRLDNIRSKSWLLRCPATDSEQISLARELGFQPLKLFTVWSYSEKSSGASSKQLTSLPSELEWQEINENNASLLLKLEQAGESGHLRSIQDRQVKDLISQSNPSTGVLVSQNPTEFSAIAGLVESTGNGSHNSVELLRDILWDQRLTDAIPIVLNGLQQYKEGFLVETASEDVKLNKLLQNIGWEVKNETLLLGRTLWRRQDNMNLMPVRSLETMLGKLNPQSPPLPTPSLEPR